MSRELRRVALTAATLLLAAAGGCGREVRSGDPDLQLRWGFEPDPPSLGAVRITVDVSDVDWSPRNGSTVVLTGLRNGLELTVDTAVGQGAGRYLAEAFPFEVAGAWVLRTRVESPDGRWVEIERPVTVGAPGS